MGNLPKIAYGIGALFAPFVLWTVYLFFSNWPYKLNGGPLILLFYGISLALGLACLIKFLTLFRVRILIIGFISFLYLPLLSFLLLLHSFVFLQAVFGLHI